MRARLPLPFTKSHGLGNDFILLDGRTQVLPPSVFLSRTLRFLCDRHRGIGSDGVIVLQSSKVAAASMRVFNPDGSEAEACGNGFRCAAKYLWEHRLSEEAFERKTETEVSLSVETASGVLSCSIGLSRDRVTAVWVDVAMGPPRFLRKQIPVIGAPDEPASVETFFVRGKTFLVHPISMGNPHAVIFLDDPNHPCSVWARTYGPDIEEDPRFPHRANVGFARRTGAQNMELAVWERGCGLTQACGSGACAAVVAACQQGLFAQGERVTVHLPGGELEVTVLPGFENVRLRGPAVEVFSGVIPIETASS